MNILKESRRAVAMSIVLFMIMTLPIGIPAIPGISGSESNGILNVADKVYAGGDELDIDPTIVNISTQVSNQKTLQITNEGGMTVAKVDGAQIASATIANGIAIIASQPTTNKNIQVSGSGIFNIVLSGASITNSSSWNYSPLQVTGSARANIIIIGENSLAGPSSRACLNVSPDSGITISGLQSNPGKLTAKSSANYPDAAGIGGNYEEENGAICISDGVILDVTAANGAAIGGGTNAAGSDIRIVGGKVTASANGAGIGGGYYKTGSNIYISGGEVNVSSVFSAGIGGGQDASAAGIYISGGKVLAKSTHSGAAIGGGANGLGSDIYISGGEITAESNSGACIGGGYQAEGKNITISGGDITATPGQNGAAIGGGNYGTGSGILISDGTITASHSVGAGIGGGMRGVGFDIEIAGGNVSITETGSSGGGAGIGGGNYGTGSGIKISDGNISVTQKHSGACIGGGNYANGEDIEIVNGKMKFVSSNGAGIGGGANGYGNDIEISGGTIDASNGNGNSACIGGGYRGVGSDILISGGELMLNSTGGAGIGGGIQGSASDIEIAGGIVYTYSKNGAGIGGGAYAEGSKIKISGGFVNAVSESGYGIGSGSSNSDSSDIKIIGGSVIAKGSRTTMDFCSTPLSNNDESLYKVMIPSMNGAALGNKDITVGTGQNQYRAKTVTALGEQCEHGAENMYAATIYLPAGTHAIQVDNEVITATVGPDVENLDPYIASIEDCTVAAIEGAVMYEDFRISATGTLGDKIPQVGDTALFPTYWQIDSGSSFRFAEKEDVSDHATTMLESAGSYTLKITFWEYTFNGQNWIINNTASKYVSRAFTVAPGLNKGLINLAIDESIQVGADFTFTASGVEYPTDGSAETAFFPGQWEITDKNSKEKVTEGAFTENELIGNQPVKLGASGDYNLKVIFDRKNYESGNWAATGETIEKDLDFHASYVASNDKNKVEIPRDIYLDNEYTFKAIGDEPATAVDGDEKYVPSGWSIGTSTGAFDENGECEFIFNELGNHSITVTFDKYIYDRTEWNVSSGGDSVEKTVDFTVIQDPGLYIASIDNCTIPAIEDAFSEENITISAIGDLPDRTVRVNDTAYSASTWKIGTGSMNAFTDSVEVTESAVVEFPEAGTVTFEVTFEEYRFNGRNWVKSGISDTITREVIVEQGFNKTLIKAETNSPVKAGTALVCTATGITHPSIKLADKAYFPDRWTITGIASGTFSGNKIENSDSVKLNDPGHYTMVVTFTKKQLVNGIWTDTNKSYTKNMNIYISYNPSETKNTADVRPIIFAGEKYNVNATGDGPSSAVDTDEKYEPMNWTVKNIDGEITNGALTNGKGTFSIPTPGAYTMTIEFQKFVYKNAGKSWQPTSETCTTDRSIDVGRNIGTDEIEIDTTTLIKTGEELICTATGVSCDTLTTGDAAYFPSKWEVGETKGDFAENTVNATMSTAMNAPGEYDLKVTFDKKVWTSAGWQSLSDPYTTTVGFSVHTPYLPDNDNNTVTIPDQIYTGNSYKITATGDGPAAEILDDEKYVPASWKMGNVSGIFNSSGESTFSVSQSGSHTMIVYFDTYIYNNGNWTIVSDKEQIEKPVTFTAQTKPQVIDPPAPKPITTITTAQKSIYLVKGQSITLPMVQQSSDGKKAKLTYKSSNKKIATVTSSGKVKAKKKGKVTIMVTPPNGKAVKFTINVATKATKVKAVKVKYKKTMNVGKTQNLKITISPKKATKAIATFKSNKTKILTVDKAGKITAKKKGTAKVTVKAGGKRKVITIKVK